MVFVNLTDEPPTPTSLITEAYCLFILSTLPDVSAVHLRGGVVVIKAGRKRMARSKKENTFLKG